MAFRGRSRLDAVPAIVLAALAVLLATGCPGPTGRSTPGTAEDAGSGTAGSRREVGVAPRQRSREPLRPEDLLRPRWPAGWTVADATAAGPEDLPVVSWRLEARDEAAEAAVTAALDALRPLAGEIVLDDVQAEPATADEPARAVGQLRGSRLRAGVLATEARGSSQITVTVELLPGPGERP